MKEKRNTTICFNSDEMYIHDYFKSIGGKTSTEMKRVLKDFVDNNGKNSDLAVDERVSRILASVLGGGVNIAGAQFAPVENTSSQIPMNTTQNDNNPASFEEDEEEMFDLPPNEIAMGLSMMVSYEEDDLNE